MVGVQKCRAGLAALVSFAVLAGCSQPEPGESRMVYDPGAEVDEDGFRAPTDVTLAHQAEVAAHPIFTDESDFELARRGLIASEPGLDIRTADGDPVWRPSDYGFLDGPAPGSVNPSLWRQAGLNAIHGLFEVTPGIYQVRGYDLANMSLIEGETGWIIIDPLTAVETAEAAMDLVNRELGERPISAIIFTHSHIDHFGGVAGIVDPEQLASGEIPILAPEGFMEHAVSENVLAGVVMSRRASFMYGMNLPRTPRGHVGSGLGKHPAIGSHTIAAPTGIIGATGETLTIDGVDMEFQFAPGTEAPAEMTIFFPQFRAWCGAEIVSRNMHNLYTLRGAQVRDALLWSSAIEDARLLFGDRTDVIFNSHHWPVWGAEAVQTYLAAQRDIYKFIHDETLRLAAQGLGPDEIAEVITLPETLENTFAVRGYYGTLKHNARAVYQFYFGWYDGVPANLDPLPRNDAARGYVAGFGGLDGILAATQSAFDDGNYRWAAELGQHAVFAHPESVEAREALARSYEQLGYQAESGPWRDVYLSAAIELRHGVTVNDSTAAGSDILETIPLDLFFTAMATRLDSNRAADRELRFNFVFTDVDDVFVVEVSNGVMRHYESDAAVEADATVEVTREFWLRLIQQEAGLMSMLTSSDFTIQGDRAALLGFFALLEQPDPGFAVVTP